MKAAKSDKKKPFSKVKSIEETLASFDIKNYLEPESYIFSENTISLLSKEFLKSLLGKINRKLKNLDTIDFANEADREEISHLLVWECLEFIGDSTGIDLKIGSKKSLSDSKSKGILDFCIYRKYFDSENKIVVKKIFTVFETKQKDFNQGAGQLLLELKAVFKDTGFETYGAVTNFQIWQFWSYKEEGAVSIVRRFNSIMFDNVLVLNIDILEKLTYQIVDIVINHGLFKV